MRTKTAQHSLGRFAFLPPWSVDRASTLKSPHQSNGDRQREQDVYEPTEGVSRDDAKEPEYEEHDGDGPEHTSLEGAGRANRQGLCHGNSKRKGPPAAGG